MSFKCPYWRREKKETFSCTFYAETRYLSGGASQTSLAAPTDEHGKLVPQRTYPHPELGSLGSVRFNTIPPGETVTEDQEVSVLYDMSKPGKYTIQVWRRNPKYEIKSNKVTVTVTPNGEDPARNND